MAREELEEEGYKVLVDSAKDCSLSAIETLKPDLLIYEIYDPKIGADYGLNCLHDIRHAFPEMPIIIYTGVSSYRADLRSIVADYYVLKSYDLSELKQKIKMSFQSGHVPRKTVELTKTVVTELIATHLIRVINYQAQPQPGVIDFDLLRSLISEFDTNGYFTVVSENEVYSLYDRLCERFLKEEHKVRKLTTDHFRERGSLVDVDDGEQVMRFYESGNFSVLSMQRFTHEVSLLTLLMRQLNLTASELTPDAQLGAKRIVRSIEFPPEYHQAGISTLTFFGRVLQRKYPDTPARVRIEQDGLKVTTTVDPINGDKEVIESALDEYGLVVTGKMPLEEYTEDIPLLIELKSQLRIAESMIKTQGDINKYLDNAIQRKDIQIEKLHAIVADAVQKPIHSSVNIQVSPHAEASIIQEFQLAPQVSSIESILSEMARQLLGTTHDEAKVIEQIQSRLEEFKASKTRDEVRKSSAMSKLLKFLNDLNSPDSKIGKTIKGIETVRIWLKSWQNIITA